MEKSEILKNIQKWEGEILNLQAQIEWRRELILVAQKGLKDWQAINSDLEGIENNSSYPMAGSLLDKYKYLENRAGMVWRRKDLEALIEDIEGRKGARTLKHSAQKIHKLIQEGKLIALKYSGSKKYTFYTTNREWIELNYYSKGKHRIKPGHEPQSKELGRLNDDQRKQENIEWDGM